MYMNFNLKNLLSKDYLVYFIVFASFIFLNKPISLIIDKLIINNFFYKFQPSKAKDLILIIGILLIAVFYSQKRKKYIPSERITFILFFFSFCYLYYLLINPEWNFYHLYYANIFRYLDIIFVVTVLNTAFLMYHYIKEGWEPKIGKTKNTLFSDYPIQNEKGDFLGYNTYAKLIAGHINTSNFDCSFAIGINGHWGIGKSSFLKLIKNNLEDEGKIFVEFNPWVSQNPESIIVDFFELLQEKIRPYHASLSRTISQYSKKLIEISDSSITRSISLSATTIFGSDTIKEMQVKINEALQEINLKLIIVVDDLDRLDSKEIIEVLRLIRNNANFFNTYYLVAYDRSYIVSAIKDMNPNKSGQYLEKIFQMEVTLPHFDKSRFAKLLVDMIKPTISEEIQTQVEEAVLGKDDLNPNTLLSDWLTSIRDVTRLANAIVLNHKKLEKEVFFDDFIRIELLRLKYPTVYELLYRRTSDFLTTAKVSSPGFYDPNSPNQRYNLIDMPKDAKGEPNKYKYKIEEEITERISEHALDKTDIIRIIEFLNNIFSEHFNSVLSALGKNHPLSIVFPSNFKRYFTYGLPDGDFSEVSFIEARQGTIDNFKDNIDEWVNLGLEISVKKKLEEIKDFDNRGDYEKIIKATFYLASKESKRKYTNSFYVGFDNYTITNRLNKSVAKTLYEGKDEELAVFVKTVFEDAKSPYFNEVILLQEWCTEWESHYPISFEDGKQILTNYLEKYSISIDRLDTTFWNLQRACSYNEIDKSDPNNHRFIRKHFKKAQEIAESRIKLEIEPFLLDIIAYNPTLLKFFGLSDSIYYTWDDMTQFKSFLAQLEKTDYVNEFLEFLEAKEAQPNSYIKFEFKIIPVHTKKNF